MPVAPRLAAPVGALSLLAIALQIGYPLTGGGARERLTVLAVVAFAAAALSHAVSSYGARGLGCCLVAAGVGLAADISGVHTGVPFGHYRYADALGPAIAGVPAVVALAWTMMAWPAALVARRLVASMPARVIVGMWVLASWDLFLDPQMVAAGYWRWADPTPHLPGVGDVPLTNLAGWVAVSAVISLALQGLLGWTASTPRAGDGWMYALFVWAYASSVLAQLAFLHLQGAALWGALGMGVVAVPLVIRLRAGPAS